MKERLIIGWLLTWLVSALAGFLFVVGRGAGGQFRLEGTVRWADGTPGAGLVVTMRSPIAETVTDVDGRYRFDGLRAGVMVTLTVSMGRQVLGGGCRLLAREVERVDIKLVGSPSDPAFRANVRSARPKW